MGRGGRREEEWKKEQAGGREKVGEREGEGGEKCRRKEIAEVCFSLPTSVVL